MGPPPTDWLQSLPLGGVVSVNHARCAIAQHLGQMCSRADEALQVLQQWEGWLRQLPVGVSLRADGQATVCGFAANGQVWWMPQPAELQAKAASSEPDMLALREGQRCEQAGDAAGALQSYGLSMRGVSLAPTYSPESCLHGAGVLPVWDTTEHWCYFLSTLAQPYRGAAGWPQLAQTDARVLACDRLAGLYAKRGDDAMALFWARAGERLSLGHPRFRMVAAERLLALGLPALAVAEVQRAQSDPLHAWPGPLGGAGRGDLDAICANILTRASQAMPAGGGLDTPVLRSEWLGAISGGTSSWDALRADWMRLAEYDRQVADPGPVIMRRVGVQFDAYFPDAPGPVKRVRVAHFDMATFWSPLREATAMLAPALPAFRRLLEYPGAFGQLTPAGMRDIEQELISGPSLPDTLQVHRQTVAGTLDGILQQRDAHLLMTTVYAAQDQPDNALSRQPPVVWPLKGKLPLRAQLDFINTCCVQHGLPVEPMDYLPRHGGWHLSPSGIRSRAAALNATDPHQWTQLFHSPCIRLSRVATVGDASGTLPKPLELDDRYAFERWKLLGALLLQEGNAVFESIAVAYLLEFGPCESSQTVVRLTLNALETRLEKWQEGRVIETQTLAAAPGCAQFVERLLQLHGWGRSTGYHAADHRAWQWPDAKRRALIKAGLSRHIATTPATPLAQHQSAAEWCGLTDAATIRNLNGWLSAYAPTDAEIWSFNCTDMLEYVSGYALVREQELIAAMPMAVSLGM